LREKQWTECTPARIPESELEWSAIVTDVGPLKNARLDNAEAYY